MHERRRRDRHCDAFGRHGRLWCMRPLLLLRNLLQVLLHPLCTGRLLGQRLSQLLYDLVLRK